ncbi:MAG: HAD family hydrolase [Candidatus Aenigmatarchaeota archaeon]
MPKLVIFDMDGTLINSVDCWVALFEKTFEKVGVCVPRNFLKSTFGREAPEILHMLVTNGKTRQATDFFLNHQYEYIKNFKAFPHTRVVLHDLKRRGFLIAVATGNTRDLMHYFLKKFGLDEFVDFCICSEDVSRGKPDPEILNRVLGHFSLKAADALYIADSPTDLEAAKKAKIRVGIVTTGVLDRPGALKLEPDYILSDIREVEKIV